MENKKFYLTKVLLCLMLIIALTGCVALSSMGATAYAATANPSPDAEPLGLVTRISIKLGTTGAEVWADAHNDFTLGMSTVQVYVFLYSSPTYQDSYSEMTLEKKEHIDDLDINKSLRVSMPINGVQKYWKARVMYKLDKNDWVSKETVALLIDVDGNLAE